MARPSLESMQKLLERPLRLAILTGLHAGRMKTTRELADLTGAEPDVLRHHLARLRDADVIITEVHDGRHHHRLIDAGIAKAMRPLRDAARKRGLTGTLCGHHLGGDMGNAVTTSMVARGYLEEAGTRLAVTRRGAHLFNTMGLAIAQGDASKPCRAGASPGPHLGGNPGKLLCRHLLGQGWITLAEDGHDVVLTPGGRTAFSNLFGIRN